MLRLRLSQKCLHILRPMPPPTPHHPIAHVIFYFVVVFRLLQAKRGSSGASKSTALGMIALGTDKGSISVWDLKRGALAHSLGEVCVVHGARTI